MLRVKCFKCFAEKYRKMKDRKYHFIRRFIWWYQMDVSLNVRLMKFDSIIGCQKWHKHIQTTQKRVAIQYLNCLTLKIKWIIKQIAIKVNVFFEIETFIWLRWLLMGAFYYLYDVQTSLKFLLDILEKICKVFNLTVFKVYK